MTDPLRNPVDLVGRVIEIGLLTVNELARLGSDILLAAVLARLGWTNSDAIPGEPSGAAGSDPNEEGLSPTELLTRGLLPGEGRYTRREVAEKAGASFEDAQRLWRALGFAEAGDDQRVFTNADVAALAQATGLMDAHIVDTSTVVELARPLGNLMSRIAAAQTGFISEILGARLAVGLDAQDPELPQLLAAQALKTTQELLPVLELTTVYAWRRHLAEEVGRALIPQGYGLAVDAETRPAVVGFVDITGFTRLSRNLDLTELSSLLDRFETAVLDVVVENGGRVIKNLGDEILFVIEDPVSAAEAALQLIDAFEADETLPPIHTGLAFGPVLYRGGDVYGPVVNIGARLSSLARKQTIRVDQALAAELEGAEQFTLSARTPRHVRGYLQLPSYRLRRAKQKRQAREAPTDSGGQEA